MSINLNDWLGDQVWAWWLGLAVLALCAELVCESTKGRLVAWSAAAGAVSALLWPGTPGAQVAVAVALAAGLLLVGRRRDLRRQRSVG